MPGRPSIFFPPPEDWMDGPTACKGQDPNIFFNDNGHHLLNRPAIEICNTCPVQLTCLQYALDHHIADGVWGGTTGKDRRRIARTRRETGLPLRLAIDPEPPASSRHG